MEPKILKDYMGDGVYIEDIGHAIIITTECGMPTDPQNIIEVDIHVMAAIERYFARYREARK